MGFVISYLAGGDGYIVAWDGELGSFPRLWPQAAFAFACEQSNAHRLMWELFHQQGGGLGYVMNTLPPGLEAPVSTSKCVLRGSMAMGMWWEISYTDRDGVEHVHHTISMDSSHWLLTERDYEVTIGVITSKMYPVSACTPGAAVNIVAEDTTYSAALVKQLEEDPAILGWTEPSTWTVKLAEPKKKKGRK